MGCAPSLSEDDKARIEHAKAMEAQIKADEQVDADKVKLLLLGAGESGKSTIFKQMKVIYGRTYSEAERKQLTPTIFGNVLQAMHVLCAHVHIFGLEDKVGCQAHYNLVKSLDENSAITEDIGTALIELWKDATVQSVWERRAEFQVVESVQFYFNKIDEIRKPDYCPTEEDILFSRVRTSGIVTERYEIDGSTFEMYDVGGQRNERKKWIHCFEGVTAVIFVAAISEYDQNLFEDTSTNRMVEALDLFDDICNNVFFQKSSMILFLNKRDLFEDKIKIKNIKDYPAFADYPGADGDYDAGVDYFVGKFTARNKGGTARQVYHHVTCATDTKNVKVVFDACRDIILRENLKNSGLSFD